MNKAASAAAAASPPGGLGRLVPGIALSAALAAFATLLAGVPWFTGHGLSALTLSIVLGMVLGNSLHARLEPASAAGIDFSKQKLLRLGVILYGLRLTVQDIGHVGLAGVLIDALVLGSTFVLAYLAGTRALGLERGIAMLIGAGSSVCGAAAVLATEPVLKARAEQVTVSVATVVVFGTLAMFVYPLLFELNRAWGLVPGGLNGFGVYAGSTIHEVAQVVVAARWIAPEVADVAVIAKMVRVMMLAPFLVLLSAWLARSDAPDIASAPRRKAKVLVPWFALGFVGMVLFNSLRWLPPNVVAALNEFDTLLLAMAMGALGLTTRVAAIRKAGAKPLLLASLLFAWLVVGGALINRLVGTALGFH